MKVDHLITKSTTELVELNAKKVFDSLRLYLDEHGRA